MLFKESFLKDKGVGLKAQNELQKILAKFLVSKTERKIEFNVTSMFGNTKFIGKGSLGQIHF